MAQSQYKLTWNDNSLDESGFVIERSVNGGTFAQIATVGANVTTFTDTIPLTQSGPPPVSGDGNTYTYQVAAFNQNGQSFFSNSATNAPTFTTQPQSQLASVYQNVTLSAAAIGLPAPTYQWEKDGVALTDVAGHLAGSTTDTLTITSVTNADLGTYTVVASNGLTPDATSQAANLTVQRASQTISNFPTLATATFGDPPVALTAAASSNLPVSYTSSDPTVATVSGGVLTIVGVGSTTITASQPGDSIYFPATSVQQTLTVSPSSQTITFDPVPQSTYGDGSVALIATSSSGLPVTFTSGNPNIATVNGSTLTILNAGAATIVAHQVGNADYTAATDVAQTIYIAKADQTITFTMPSTMVYGDAPYTLTATSSSGLTVSFGSSQLSIANVNGNTLTLVGSGSLNITASQLGNLNYNAAPPVTLPLTVNQPPTFTVNPSSVTAQPGYTVHLGVSVKGSPAPTLQWQFSTDGGASWTGLINGGAYSGTDLPQLTITGVTAAMNGYEYNCRATNTVDTNRMVSTASTAATLTVNSAPVFTVQPVVANTAPGGNAAFTIATIGNPAPMYQWQVSTSAGGTTFVNITNDTTYSGATTPTLSLTDVPTSLNGYVYRCVATNSLAPGGVISSTATLTLGSVAPSISTQPASQTVASGTSATFQVAATGYPIPTYQWMVSTDSGVTWNPVPTSAPYSGGTSATLTISDVTGLNGYQYECVVSNKQGPVTSNAATLTVQPNVPPSFTTQPADASVAYGGHASFSVQVAGTAPISLQWQLSTDGGVTWTNVTNAAPYSGATSATLQITGASAALNGTEYQCLATNVVASNVASSPASLSVVAVAPTFTTQPASQTVTAGTTVTFTAGASGNPTPVYQWQISTDGGTTWNALTNTAPYSGVTTSTLVLTSVPQSLSGTEYECVASNAGGPANSNVVTLVVYPAPVNSAPAILSQPSSETVPLNGSATFRVYATGAPAPTYQWRFNGAPISGATSATFVKSGVQATDSGNYDVVVTNFLGSVTSSAATLTVNAPPVIVTQPLGGTVTPGADFTVSVTATGKTPLTYQWRFNGTPITGATGSTYTVTNVRAASAGAYDVVVTNSIGSVTSNAALLGLESYAGEYFGTLSGGGSWALYVRPDNTGTYIAYLPDRKTALVVQVVVDASGSFTAPATEISSTTMPTTQSIQLGPRRAAEATAVTVSGTITNGQVTGQVAGIGETLSGTADIGAGATAGLYTAPAIAASSGTAYSIIGPSGQALVVTTTASSADGASGTLSSTGQLTATSANGAVVSITINPTADSLTATYTTTGGTGVQFAGVADTVPVTTRLINLSARAPAGSGSATLIAGFTLSGTDAKPILVRGIGPTLTGYGVTDAVPDPALSLYAGQTVLAANDNWSAAANPDAIAAAAKAVGAFPLTANSLDASLLPTLNPGTYTAEVAANGNADGVALVEIYDAGTSNTRLINVSARADVGTGTNVAIVGFVVAGNAPKQFLVRAVGPSLAPFGVTGYLADPQLTLMQQGSSTPLAQNDNWGGTTTLENAFNRVGAFALDPASKDAAIVITLDPGAYTAIVSGTNNTTGVALIEVYQLP